LGGWFGKLTWIRGYDISISISEISESDLIFAKKFFHKIIKISNAKEAVSTVNKEKPHSFNHCGISCFWREGN